MSETKVRELASEAYRWFERIKRGDETIVTLKNGRPDWVQNLVFESHGKDGSGSPLFFPDDWRYDTIHSALGFIHDNCGDLDDLSHEFADGTVDVYTHARLQWLASNLNRPGYVDEGVRELGGEGLDETERIGLGQYMEASEIYSEVLSALRELAEDEE